MIPARTPSRVVIVVPRLRTMHGLNDRMNNLARYRLAQREMAVTRGALQLYQFKGGFNQLPALPVHVHMVRVSPGHRPPDSDNLHGYLKNVRDAVADYFNVDDGDESKITFSVSQEKGTAHLVRIEIEARR